MKWPKMKWPKMKWPKMKWPKMKWTSMKWPGRRRSLRTRLTLWNVAVMGVVLAGFGVALVFTLQYTLAAGVDRELQNRAATFADRWSRGEPFGPGGPQPRGRVRLPTPSLPPIEPPSPSQPLSAGPKLEPVSFTTTVQQGPVDAWPGERRGRGPGRPGWDRQGGWDGEEGFGFPGEPFEERQPPRPREPLDPIGRIRRPRVLLPDGKPMMRGSDDTPWDAAAISRGKSTPLLTTIRLEDEPYRVMTHPLLPEQPDDRRPAGVVQFAQPIGDLERIQRGVSQALLALVPLSLLAAGVGALFLSGRALAPIRDLTHATASISEKDLAVRLHVASPPGQEDELEELALTFNGMLSRLDDAFQRLERAFEQQRRFSADASHELRTPLTIIKGNTSLALSGPRSVEYYQEVLREADTAADSMMRIVQDLLFLARSDAGELRLETQYVDLREVLPRWTRRLKEASWSETALSLEINPGTGEEVAVLGDLHHLERLVNNLVENAFRYTPADGVITLSATRRGNCVVLEVRDTGEGIAAEHLEHLGERFYRGDASRSRSGGGAGLGLSICRSIVAAHGGTLDLASTLGAGTTVTVSLPAA